VVDVRDLAAWLVASAEARVAGVMNVCGAPVPFGEHLAVARGGSSAETIAVPEEWLLERGVGQWAGPGSLPLWIADPAWRGMNARSTARAEAAGFERRELAETLRPRTCRDAGRGWRRSGSGSCWRSGVRGGIEAAGRLS
jgi:hypothetical protein